MSLAKALLPYKYKEVGFMRTNLTVPHRLTQACAGIATDGTCWRAESSRGRRVDKARGERAETTAADGGLGRVADGEKSSGFELAVRAIAPR